MDPRRERRALASGVHIVVGTPGRLCDHLERGALVLARLEAVVLDEADEMLDMGFREDLERLLDAAPQERRTLLFSATIPKAIAALAKRYQKHALRIATLGDSERHRDIEYQAVPIVAARARPRRRQPASLPRRARRARVLRDARRRPPLAREPHRARLLGRALSGELASASAIRRSRRCATGARASASRPTSPRADSTCHVVARDPRRPAAGRRSAVNTARVAPAAPDARERRS